jgi:nucleoside phosphorylase
VVLAGHPWEAWALRGWLSGSGVVVRVAGPGPRRALQNARAAVDELAPRALLGVGFAGGLDEDLPAGAVVCPERVWDPQGREMGLARWPRRHSHGVVVSWPQVVGRRRDKARLARRGGRVVDQETWWWAQAAAERHVPLVVVRVVLDRGGEDAWAAWPYTAWGGTLVAAWRAWALRGVLGRAAWEAVQELRQL